MIELAHTLLPNLPNNLNWVYGIVYIIETVSFFLLLLSPLYMLFGVVRRKRR